MLKFLIDECLSPDLAQTARDHGFHESFHVTELDATLSRTLLAKENRALEVRAEGFNIFNHAQFFGAAAVDGNISSGSFGQAVSAMPPRLMQLAVRY